MKRKSHEFPFVGGRMGGRMGGGCLGKLTFHSIHGVAVTVRLATMLTSNYVN